MQVRALPQGSVWNKSNIEKALNRWLDRSVVRYSFAVFAIGLTITAVGLLPKIFIQQAEPGQKNAAELLAASEEIAILGKQQAKSDELHRPVQSQSDAEEEERCARAERHGP
jgi:hypothetical protein